mgnify:CR=1 FL=1
MAMDPGTAMVIGSMISGIGSFFGGNKAADAARRQAEMQNQANERRYYYDNQMWDMKRSQLITDRNHTVDTIEAQARNEGRRAQWQDAVNIQKYGYDMMIRNREQRSLNQQYLRSDMIYGEQLTMNALSARAGKQNELRKYQEIQAEGSFDQQEASLDAIITEGKLRARGQNGRSLGKAKQATLADYGRQMALLNESLSGAGRNTRAVLQEIARDKSSADLAAFAQKMLDPGVLPEPLVPFATPMSEYVFPRVYNEDFDFGPRPVYGAMADPNAAASAVWGQTISSIAGTVGGSFMSYGLKN